MPEVNVNNTTLFYEEKGEGEALILLHGLTSNHLMLKQEMKYFKDYFRVIAIDARGHGKSDKPSTYTLDDHIKDTIALMDKLDIDQANLIGMSMGTYIAQGVAIKVPDRVKKMILVSGNTHAKDETEGLLAEHQEEIGHLSFEEQMGEMAGHIFHNMEAVSKWLQSIPGGLTSEQQVIAADALADFDFRPDLKNVKAETLVISGKHDGLNPPSEGKEIADLIPRAKFVEFEHSGHAPGIEETDKYMSLISDFLQ